MERGREMEREGEGREEGKMRRGRREGRKMRKGIVIGGMVLGLLFGCNNGEIEQLGKRNQFLSSLANLGNEFLNVFTSFGDMISGETLEFNVDTKKSDVGLYFKKVKETVEGTKSKLNKIVDNMKAENNPNATSVEGAVNKLVSEKLDKIIEGANQVKEAIVDTGTDLIGNVAAQGAGGAAGEVDKLLDGIKGIVKVVLGEKEGNSEAGDDKKSDDGTAQRGDNAGEAGKLFTNAQTGGDKKPAADAAKAVGAVTGADILKAIAKEGGDSVKLAKHNAAVGTITSGSGVAQHAKDGTIAGAIVLRAMAKGGKFANGNSGQDMSTAIKGAAASAVTKALNTLTIAIRKTIDEGLKKVKEAMNINPETTPLNSEGTTNK